MSEGHDSASELGSPVMQSSLPTDPLWLSHQTTFSNRRPAGFSRLMLISPALPVPGDVVRHSAYHRPPRSPNTSNAQFRPGAPNTAPPGHAPDPHRYNPSTGVR